MKKENLQPDRLSAEVKELALESGASLVGVVSAEAIDDLPRIFVGWTIHEYTKKTVDTMPDAKSVVVIGYHLWDKMLELAIQKNNDWKYPGYFALPFLSQTIINHLEKNHYKAAMTGSLSYKRLAQLAGLGNYGKNALIINPVYGPWIRLGAVITNAEMTPDKPFEKDLCGPCQACLKACPVGALTPHKVDDFKCLVGAHLAHKEKFEQNKEWTKIEPSLTKNSHLMCTQCQDACRYGKQKTPNPSPTKPKIEEDAKQTFPSSPEISLPATHGNITNRHAQPTSKLHAYQHETPR